MKIKTFLNWNNDDNDEEMNSELEELINQGFMIIDYGIQAMPDDKIHGYIKYCDKQFLRDYKISSIMKEL
jgi:hypothetical protein